MHRSPHLPDHGTAVALSHRIAPGLSFDPVAGLAAGRPRKGR